MIETLDWLRSVTATARMRGGQAPVCWRKALSREMAPVVAIRRACEWVGEVAAISPKLRDGPLFGDCLGELTRPAEASPQPDPEVARPRWKQMTQIKDTTRTDLH